MRYTPLIVASKTLDESPPWYTQSWYTPRYAP